MLTLLYTAAATRQYSYSLSRSVLIGHRIQAVESRALVLGGLEILVEVEIRLYAHLAAVEMSDLVQKRTWPARESL